MTTAGSPTATCTAVPDVAAGAWWVSRGRPSESLEVLATAAGHHGSRQHCICMEFNAPLAPTHTAACVTPLHPEHPEHPAGPAAPPQICRYGLRFSASGAPGLLPGYGHVAPADRAVQRLFEVRTKPPAKAAKAVPRTEWSAQFLSTCPFPARRRRVAARRPGQNRVRAPRSPGPKFKWGRLLGLFATRPPM